MNCRKFKSQHVGFIDDLLSAVDMLEMRRHIDACARCAMIDVRIRRSLLVMRNIPQIEPSADFYVRLSERLRAGPVLMPSRRPQMRPAVVLLTTAAVAAAAYFAMAVGIRRTSSEPVRAETVAIASPSTPSPIADPALTAAAPAGIPVWPAMFMVADLPMHLANAELLDNGISR